MKDNNDPINLLLWGGSMLLSMAAGIVMGMRNERILKSEVKRTLLEDHKK